MKQKLIFIFARGITLGGMETSTLRLAGALAGAGHEVKLLIHGGPDRCHPLLRDQWDALHPVFLPKEGDANEETVAQTYADEGPAVVFPNQSAWAYGHLRMAKCNLGADLRIFGICHSDFPDYYQLAEDQQDIVDVQFGVSRHMCEQLDRRLRKPSKLLILGVDVPKTYPDRTPRKRLEILYTGRIENSGKRCSELIPAGEEIRKRGVKFRMTIAGDGPYLKWLKGEDFKKVPWWARRHYRILGAVAPKDLIRLYRESDIYLSFTRFEGNSIAVMEAMAQGCVPVIPRVSGTETIIESGQSGWLTAVDDKQGLISKCMELAVKRGDLSKMSVEAHRRALEMCDISNTVVTVIKAIRV